MWTVDYMTGERELLVRTAAEIWREVRDVEKAARIARLLLAEVDRQMEEAVTERAVTSDK